MNDQRPPPANLPRSLLPNVEWPAWPAPADALTLALVQQLEHTQWWTPQQLAEHQARQLRHVLAHARQAVPWYRERLADIDPATFVLEDLARLPLLQRADVRAAGDALVTRNLPPRHRPMGEVRTSGSTGQPVVVRGSAVTRAFFRAFNVRHHLWHGRDFALKACAIRYAEPGKAMPPDGQRDPAGWVATFATGPAMLLSAAAPLDQQIAWVERERPAYLLTYPTLLAELARHCQARGGDWSFLRGVATFAEIVTADLRAACRQAWGLTLVDMYSCQETGMLASQCPAHEHYHVVSEGAVVEVLDDDDRPCAPGAIGRVVVTDLHNLASPLIRYELGDFAEAGEPCDCGRGLPVLARIVGRARNMLHYPDGRRAWPALRIGMLGTVAPVVQLQLVQKAPDRIEVCIAPERPVTPAEESALTRMLHEALGHPFELAFRYVERIPRSAGGKFEDFRSEISATS